MPPTPNREMDRNDTDAILESHGARRHQDMGGILRLHACWALPLLSFHGDVTGICERQGAEGRGHSLG